MKAFLVAASLAVLAPHPSFADVWTDPVGLVAVEPHATWQGGILRVILDRSLATSACGTTYVFDFVYSGGTQESRATVVSGLMMALAANKQVRLYISDAACSPPGAPLITGAQIVN